MPTTYSVGTEITLTSTFISHNETTDSEVVISPVVVAGVITKLNTSTLEYEPFSTFTPTEVAEGVYSYAWTPSQNGKFNIVMTAGFGSGQTSENIRFIYIGPISTTDTLNSNLIYIFLGQLDPLYLDPESILLYYPEADLAEVAELIHWHSRDLLAILNVTSLAEITPLMEQYLLASVLCDLSKIYTFGGGLAGFTSSDSFGLGDLNVKSGTGSRSNSGSNGRGGATTWCDLAAILRDELTTSKAGSKTYVRGSNYYNPMPSRHLRRID